jgi:hypothetical protein
LSFSSVYSSLEFMETLVKLEQAKSGRGREGKGRKRKGKGGEERGGERRGRATLSLAGWRAPGLTWSLNLFLSFSFSSTLHSLSLIFQ